MQSGRGLSMKPFISYKKLSKKKRREMDRKKRVTWSGINPVTRKPENPRAYNRRKLSRWTDE